MFEGFFYQLRDLGIPVTPTAFLRLNQALAEGLIASLEDFYVVARALLVKQERHFDLYDQVFAHYFEGKPLDRDIVGSLAADLKQLLQEWLNDPLVRAALPREERDALQRMTPEELEQYFLDRLREQTERHDGGNRWIGTGGTSPVGHGGRHDSGMRVGGQGRNHGAIKVALERRYIDYSDHSPLTAQQLGEALRALRQLAPIGPKDRLDIDETIYETVRNAGEIELVFERSLRDKLSVYLFIDNGGWSMDPFVPLTRALFGQARNVFKQLRTFFFHNCIYATVWEDQQRMYRPFKTVELLRAEPETRVAIVGDASMGPYELIHPRGALDISTRQYRAGMDYLRALRERFPHSVWINPIPARAWDSAYGSYTIQMIAEVFPMVDLTLGGIEKAVKLLSGRKR